MAQISQKLLGDPWTLANGLNTLATTSEIQIVKKTTSSGTFIIVSDNAAPSGQIAVVIAGDPQKLSDEINAIIAIPAIVEIVEPTFSSSHYVVVYK
jgi:hypothetical protein